MAVVYFPKSSIRRPEMLSSGPCALFKLFMISKINLRLIVIVPRLRCEILINIGKVLSFIMLSLSLQSVIILSATRLGILHLFRRLFIMFQYAFGPVALSVSLLPSDYKQISLEVVMA